MGKETTKLNESLSKTKKPPKPAKRKAGRDSQANFALKKTETPPVKKHNDTKEKTK